MKWIKFIVITDSGKKEISINVEQVCAIVPIAVTDQTGLIGPGGKPISKEVAGLDTGLKIIPVDCSVEEALRKILRQE